ncbi:hypothetical protein FRC08_000512 [Ceratobasidium sp. 394]|nr:hypothetical protein FRC08_000512 [Ceratobasidium sp. 394]
MKYSIAGPYLDDAYCYLGDADAIRKLDWSVGYVSEGPSDVLVNRKGDFVRATGLFTIEHSGFRLNPLTVYNPDAPSAVDHSKGHVRAYSEALGSIQLGPVPSRYGEFLDYCANLRTLMARVHPLPIQRGLFVNNGNLSNLVVRHRMFKDRELKDSPFEYNEAHFEMANWPVSPNCKAFHDAIAGTHKPCPVHAWVAGVNDLVHPSDYNSVLRGAVALVDFTLIHQVVGTEVPASRFMALIDRIVVLENEIPNDFAYHFE